MKQQILAFAMCSAVVVVVSIPFSSLAQTRSSASTFPGARVASSQTPTANHQTKTLGTPSYTYTLLSFPGTLATYAYGINSGATTSKIAIVGEYDPAVESTQAGFLTHVSAKKTTTETYQTVNYPHVPPQQNTSGVNDSGEIVGCYVDGSDVIHGYERIGGKFTTLDVPFAGATGTCAFGINNSGQIVGQWLASDGSIFGFTLIGGTYTSFGYPGSTYTNLIAVNNSGNIAGWYEDAGGVFHGLTLSGGTSTSFDFPGAVETFGEGINDAGDIVGVYCTTSQCASTFEGAQGFVLSGSVFTTIAIPGEVQTVLTSINDNGAILGYYEDAAGLVASFLATP